MDVASSALGLALPRRLPPGDEVQLHAQEDDVDRRGDGVADLQVVDLEREAAAERLGLQDVARAVHLLVGPPAEPVLRVEQPLVRDHGVGHEHREEDVGRGEHALAPRQRLADRAALPVEDAAGDERHQHDDREDEGLVDAGPFEDVDGEHLVLCVPSSRSGCGALWCSRLLCCLRRRLRLGVRSVSSISSVCGSRLGLVRPEGLRTRRSRLRETAHTLLATSPDRPTRWTSRDQVPEVLDAFLARSLAGVRKRPDALAVALPATLGHRLRPGAEDCRSVSRSL